MTASLWLAPLFALISSTACSASGTAAPGSSATLQGGSSGTSNTSTGGTSSSSGGNASTTGGTPGGIDVPVAGMSGTAGEANCGHQDFSLVREPADVLLVLDRSASMTEKPKGATDTTTKWDLVVPALTEVIASTDSSVAWGMKSYPEGEGSECIVGSVTERIDVPIAAANATAVNQAILTTTPKGNGTPTGDAVKQAVLYMKTLTTSRPKFLLLATDGEPSCAGTSEGQSTAIPYAVQAVSDALAAGLPTYVVGIATTKDSASKALNDMAIAGGKPRGDTNPLATRYYLANTKSELVTSLQTITGEVNKSCVFPLKPPPPSPEFIGVYVAGEKIERDDTKTNGWAYTSADFSSLEVFGAGCDAIKGAADRVEITYGCKSNPPR